MLLRALAIWFVLLMIAFANGAARAIWIIPRAGDSAGHIISCLTLSTAILLLTWATIEWMGPSSADEAVVIGGAWLALTLAFEFGAGHYLFRQPWSALLQDYNLARGRLWVLVLIATALGPLWAGWVRGLFALRPA